MPDLIPNYGWSNVTLISNHANTSGEGRNLKRYRRSISAHRWELELTTPYLNDREQREFFGFLQGLRGTLGTFEFIHPRYSKPLGTIHEEPDPKLSNPVTAGQTKVKIAGLSPGDTGYYVVGDPFRISGDRKVYTVTSVGKVDNFTVGEIGISPPLVRDSPENTAIITENISFVLMLEEDPITVEMDGGDGFLVEYTVTAVEDV